MTGLIKQKVKQKYQFMINSSSISSKEAHEFTGKLLLLQGSIVKMREEYQDEVYLPRIYRDRSNEGQSQPPASSFSKFFISSGYTVQCSGVHAKSLTSVTLSIIPPLSCCRYNFTSKYLFVSDRFNLQSSIPNMKLDSGFALMLMGVGSICFVRLSWVEMTLRLRVSRIMLAKPTKMAIMMPTDRKPPVSVLYQPSLSYRSISVAQNMSVLRMTAFSL